MSNFINVYFKLVQVKQWLTGVEMVVTPFPFVVLLIVNVMLSSDSGVAKCARYPRDRDTEQCFFSPKVFIYSEMRGR